MFLVSLRCQLSGGVAHYLGPLQLLPKNVISSEVAYVKRNANASWREGFLDLSHAREFFKRVIRIRHNAFSIM